MSCPVKVHAHHVAMFTKDIDKTVEFWEDVFSFKKMFENVFFLPDYGDARMAWLKAPEEDFYVELYDFPGLEADEKERYWKEYGTKHFCMYVADEDWDTIVKHIEEKGINIFVRGEHTPDRLGKPTNCKVIFFDDPNGNRIELQQSYTPGEY